MSRPNKRREIFAEDNLARRIAAERDAQGWSNDGLAKRMSDAGCPMTGSAIFKIEKAEPRRRIVVDELVTFAKVFGLSMEELLLAPEMAANRETARLVVDWSEADQAARAASAVRKARWEALQDYIAAHPESTGTLQKALETWAGQHFEEQNREGATAFKMFQVTRSEQWEERFYQILEQDGVQLHNPETKKRA
jgi:transcriptional regulator with XRE-family HTH domain